MATRDGGRLHTGIVTSIDGPQDRDRVQPGQFELGTDGPSTIIVGIDGSDTSMRAGAYAAGLARRQRARLICVYVRHTPALAYGAEVAAAAVVTNNQVAEEIENLVRQQTAIWQMRAEFVNAEGDPYSVITGIAHDVSADAIVVGASSQLGHRFAGSLAVRLVKCGRWPVTVVP
jgi:nucleotide-binding universal stress UspA family protein